MTGGGGGTADLSASPLHAACLDRSSVIPRGNRSQSAERHTGSTITSREAGTHRKDQTCEISHDSHGRRAPDKLNMSSLNSGFIIKVIINRVRTLIRASLTWEQQVYYRLHSYVTNVHIVLPASY